MKQTTSNYRNRKTEEMKIKEARIQEPKQHANETPILAGLQVARRWCSTEIKCHMSRSRHQGQQGSERKAKGIQETNRKRHDERSNEKGRRKRRAAKEKRRKKEEGERQGCPGGNLLTAWASMGGTHHDDGSHTLSLIHI